MPGAGQIEAIRQELAVARCRPSAGLKVVQLRRTARMLPSFRPDHHDDGRDVFTGYYRG